MSEVGINFVFSTRPYLYHQEYIELEAKILFINREMKQFSEYPMCRMSNINLLDGRFSLPDRLLVTAGMGATDAAVRSTYASKSATVISAGRSRRIENFAAVSG